MFDHLPKSVQKIFGRFWDQIFPECSKENVDENHLPKIETFEHVMSNFAKIGIVPELVTQRYPINARILMMVFFGTLSHFLSGFYFLFDAETFLDYTQSVYVCSVGVLLSNAFLTLLAKVKTLYQLRQDFEYLVNYPFKFSDSRATFRKVNRLVDILSEILFILVVQVPAFAPIPYIALIYFLYFTTDLGNDVFESPVKMWFPFNQRTPYGFIVEICIQWVLLGTALVLGMNLVIFGIGAFLNASTASKCLKKNLLAINESVKKKKSHKLIMEQIIEFVQFNSLTHQLITKFTTIFEPILMHLFLWNLVTICGALLMIRIELASHSDDILVLVVTIAEAIYSLGTLFLACELGQRFNLAFVKCSDQVDQLSWYAFPPKAQRMQPIIIIFSHQPVIVKCFGSAAAERDTFKYVAKTAFSYSTMLREFYK